MEQAEIGFLFSYIFFCLVPVPGGFPCFLRLEVEGALETFEFTEWTDSLSTESWVIQRPELALEELESEPESSPPGSPAAPDATSIGTDADPPVFS